jgi:type I restriction-modification system DNA methylase subunit
MNQYVKDFIKVLEHLKPSKHGYEVFSDWLIMAAASLYSWKRDPETEKEYMNVASGYTRNELESHGSLLGITVAALEDTEQDFLGEVFTFAELTNSRNGQFFTPYHVSKMMAAMAVEEKGLPQNRVCRINDPCCGAGGMLIATAMVMKARGFNYQRNAFFMGQDIDHRCARMAFIQLSLLGIPALIVCGNTLTMEIYWQRETIGYHISGMDFRLRAEKMLNIIKDKDVPVPVEPRKLLEQTASIHEIKITSLREYVQRDLF